MLESYVLKWKRPESSDYPKVWHKFQAKDVNTDDSIDYRIEDLPETKSQEVIPILIEYFCKEAPIWNAYEFHKCPEAVKTMVSMWETAMKQKMALVCFNTRTMEIAGLNINFVESKDEHIMDDILQQDKSERKKIFGNIVGYLYKDFDVYEHYGVDNYLNSVSLVVNPKYRGRGIGEHLIKTRKLVCEEFGIKLTSTLFTSDHSIRIARKLGFKTDRIRRYDEIRKTHPELNLPPIKSEEIAIMSMQF